MEIAAGLGDWDLLHHLASESLRHLLLDVGLDDLSCTDEGSAAPAHKRTRKNTHLCVRDRERDRETNEIIKVFVEFRVTILQKEGK